LIDEQLLLDAKADAERMHNLFPDERRRSIDFHFALCKIHNEQAQWLMRFSKYGDSTDRALYKELNRRDKQLKRFRELVRDIRNSKAHCTTNLWYAEIDAVVRDIDAMVGE
jgi:predicted transcriptional regulator